MRSLLATPIALLLVAAAIVVPIGATAFTTATAGPPQFDEPSPMIAPVDDFANYAAIPAANVTTASYGTATVDVGTSIAADSATLESEYRSTSFEDDFEGTNDASERDEIVATYADAIEDRTDSLQQRRLSVVEAFATDRLSPSGFVRSMALIDARANQQAVVVDRIKRITRTASYSLPRGLDTRLENLRGELEVLRGPVARRAARAASGDGELSSIYAEGASEGYTLAMVYGDSYVRETYLANERQPAATDKFRESDLYLVNAANRRGVELYPWVTNDTSPSGQALGETGIYRFRAEYTSGELTAYLDGGTTNVFREQQRQSVTAVPVSASQTVTNGSLRVRTTFTYETGPMNVTVVDNTTGTPVDATVSINGQEMGRTGGDGTLWMVEPRPGLPMTVRSDDGTIVRTRLQP